MRFHVILGLRSKACSVKFSFLVSAKWIILTFMLSIFLPNTSIDIDAMVLCLSGNSYLVQATLLNIGENRNSNATSNLFVLVECGAHFKVCDAYMHKQRLLDGIYIYLKSVLFCNVIVSSKSFRHITPIGPT